MQTAYSFLIDALLGHGLMLVLLLLASTSRLPLVGRWHTYWLFWMEPVKETSAHDESTIGEFCENFDQVNANRGSEHSKLSRIFLNWNSAATFQAQMMLRDSSP